MTNPDEAEIRAQRECWKEAVEACDIDGVMSFYVEGAEYLGFDVMPPFRYDGSAAFRETSRSSESSKVMRIAQPSNQQTSQTLRSSSCSRYLPKTYCAVS